MRTLAENPSFAVTDDEFFELPEKGLEFFDDSSSKGIELIDAAWLDAVEAAYHKAIAMIKLDETEVFDDPRASWGVWAARRAAEKDLYEVLNTHPIGRMTNWLNYRPTWRTRAIEALTECGAFATFGDFIESFNHGWNPWCVGEDENQAYAWFKNSHETYVPEPFESYCERAWSLYSD